MHVTPLFINLHWLPIAARIKFKALMFAYKTTSGSAPLYLNSLLQTYVPLEASASEHRFIVSSQRATKIHFHRLLNELFPPGGMTCPTQSGKKSP